MVCLWLGGGGGGRLAQVASIQQLVLFGYSLVPIFGMFPLVLTVLNGDPY